jgi:beta-glucosidase
VVQLYVGDPDASVRRPPRELRTFAKVHLAPGETRDVRLRLTMRDLAFWDPVTSAWVAEAGDFLLWAGVSSRQLAAPATVTLTCGWTASAADPLPRGRG